MTYQKWLFLAFLTLLVMACVEFKLHSKGHIVGYVTQEMVRAKDSLRYLDTVGIIYRVKDSIFVKDRPGVYNFQRFSAKNCEATR